MYIIIYPHVIPNLYVGLFCFRNFKESWSSSLPLNNIDVQKKKEKKNEQSLCEEKTTLFMA